MMIIIPSKQLLLLEGVRATTAQQQQNFLVTRGGSNLHAEGSVFERGKNIQVRNGAVATLFVITHR